MQWYQVMCNSSVAQKRPGLTFPSFSRSPGSALSTHWSSFHILANQVEIFKTVANYSGEGKNNVKSSVDSVGVNFARRLKTEANLKATPLRQGSVTPKALKEQSKMRN